MPDLMPRTDRLPIKQGLKLYLPNLISESDTRTDRLPIKQGLKPCLT